MRDFKGVPLDSFVVVAASVLQHRAAFSSGSNCVIGSTNAIIDRIAQARQPPAHVGMESRRIDSNPERTYACCVNNVND
jgi:hypothetical protein